MIKYITYLKNIALFLSILIVFSCSEETVYDLPTGQLLGYVSLNKITDTGDGDSGVKVTVEGSDPEIEVSTDSTGKYIINDLEAGTYNFIFSKEGYGTYKMYGEKFIGGDKPGVLDPVYLSEYSDIVLDSISLYYVSNYSEVYFVVNVFLPEEMGSYFYLRYYISDNPEVNYTSYKQTDINYLYYTRGQLKFEVSEIDTIKYPVGSDIYLIAYPVSINSSSSFYVNLDSGLDIYSAVNPDNSSNVLTITVPETGIYY